MADRTLYNLVYRIARDVARGEMKRSGVIGTLPDVGASQRPGASASTGHKTDLAPPHVITGGAVRAQDPIGFVVYQEPLTGVSYGHRVTVPVIVEINIPSNALPLTGYIQITSGGTPQFVQHISDPSALVTAVIHLPWTDTYGVADFPSDDPEDHVGWIEPFDRSFFNGDIDSNDPALQNAIREIAAEGIIGDLVLSQTLKIINAAGSIVMDSESMQIFDHNGNLRALFDQDSVDFFNPQGNLTATFGGELARIGEIEIHPDHIRSSQFVPASGGGLNAQGFALFADGTVNFGNFAFEPSGTTVLGTPLPEFKLYNTTGQVAWVASIGQQRYYTKGVITAQWGSNGFQWYAGSTANELGRLSGSALQFFDSNGNVTASYGRSQTRIGQIVIAAGAVSGDMHSTNYIPGEAGFVIRSNGVVEFEDATIRGSLHVPEFDIVDYQSGSATFSFIRRRHLIEDLTVSHGDVLLFTDLMDHKSNAVPDFENPPVVILRENDVPCWHPNFTSEVWRRRMFATPIQSGSALRYNAVEFTLQFRAESAGHADVVLTGSNLAPDAGIGGAPGGTATVRIDEPTGANSTALADALITQVQFCLTQNINEYDDATYRYDYTVACESGSNTGSMTINSGGPGTTVCQGGTVSITGLPLENNYGIVVTLNSRTKLGGDGTLLTHQGTVTRLTYRLASGSIAITDAVVDMEITED